MLDGMFGREDEIREAALMWERYARARVLNGGACARAERVCSLVRCVCVCCVCVPRVETERVGEAAPFVVRLSSLSAETREK